MLIILRFPKKTSRATHNALAARIWPAGRVFVIRAVLYMRTACKVSISRRDSVPSRSDARPPKIWLLFPFCDKELSHYISSVCPPLVSN